jgi:hypothetical protein
VTDNLDVRGPDELGALTQLAARWAERYPSGAGEGAPSALQRFRTVYDYLEAVVQGFEPPQSLTLHTKDD